ncbi:triacylglycerol lipase [Xylella fastidiosa]|nr:triacylglycerol lipase [Xylella fastidiosa]
MFAALKSLTTLPAVIFSEDYPSVGLSKLASCEGLYQLGGVMINRGFGSNDGMVSTCSSMFCFDEIN